MNGHIIVHYFVNDLFDSLLLLILQEFVCASTLS